MHVRWELVADLRGEPNVLVVIDGMVTNRRFGRSRLELDATETELGAALERAVRWSLASRRRMARTLAGRIPVGLLVGLPVMTFAASADGGSELAGVFSSIAG